MCCVVGKWPIPILFNLLCWLSGTSLYRIRSSFVVVIVVVVVVLLLLLGLVLALKHLHFFCCCCCSADVQHAAVIALQGSASANVSDLQLGPGVHLLFSKLQLCSKTPSPLWQNVGGEQQKLFVCFSLASVRLACSCNAIPKPASIFVEHMEPKFSNLSSMEYLFEFNSIDVFYSSTDWSEPYLSVSAIKAG